MLYKFESLPCLKNGYNHFGIKKNPAAAIDDNFIKSFLDNFFILIDTPIISSYAAQHP